MRDKRPVDELSIEELERILAIRKREVRKARLQRYESNGRRIVPSETDVDVDADPDTPEPAPTEAGSPAAQPADDPRIYFEGEPQLEDELDVHRHPKRAGRKSLKVMIWNRALLLVEIV